MKAFGCADVERRLSAFLDGELPIEEQRVIRAHLASCAVCAAEAQAVESVGALLREAAPGRSARLGAGARREFDLVSLPARVASQVAAERAESWPTRVRQLFEDWHLVWAGLSGTTSAMLCVGLAAVMAATLAPGSERNPVVARDAASLPQVATSSAIMPAALTSRAPYGGDLDFAVSGVITREGRFSHPELVGASFNEDVAKLLLLELAETRFEPVSRNGAPVAVSVVWLLSRMTVRPDAPADIKQPGALRLVEPNDRTFV